MMSREPPDKDFGPLRGERAEVQSRSRGDRSEHQGSAVDRGTIPTSRELTRLALTMDTGRARRSDAPTSIDAASAVNVTARAAQVELVLIGIGEGTAHDVSRFLRHVGIDMPSNVVCRRLLDLERADRAVRGEARTGAYGRPGATWRPT
jgi:hypothetical protein